MTAVSRELERIGHTDRVRAGKLKPSIIYLSHELKYPESKESNIERKIRDVGRMRGKTESKISCGKAKKMFLSL